MTKPSTSVSGVISILLAVLSIAAMVLAGGIYLGKLEQRITNLERATTFYHGSVELPPSPKGN